jgi:hypothetical protein
VTPPARPRPSAPQAGLQTRLTGACTAITDGSTTVKLDDKEELIRPR